MPSVFLSPSLQTGNKCILGDSEAVHMNFVADAMVPLFSINGISYRRNNLSQTLAQAIAESNSGNHDLHLAMHSNAGAGIYAGNSRGSYYYYNTYSVRGKQMAEITSANMKEIYPLPDRVFAVPSLDFIELNQTRAPTLLAEVAFHDNLQDAQWLHGNIQQIAQTLMMSVCEFLGKSYIPPCILGSTPGTRYVYTGLAYGFVCTERSDLNIRLTPNGEILFTLPRGTQVLVISGRENGFIKIRHNHTEGYASEQFLCVCNAPALPFSARLGIVNTQASNLNLRAAPSTSSPVIASMPRGSEVVVLGQSGNFYQVLFNGISGCASSMFIKV